MIRWTGLAPREFEFPFPALALTISLTIKQHVVFGRVLKAMASKTLDRIEDCGSGDDSVPVEKMVQSPPQRFADVTGTFFWTRRY